MVIALMPLDEKVDLQGLRFSSDDVKIFNSEFPKIVERYFPDWTPSKDRVFGKHYLEISPLAICACLDAIREVITCYVNATSMSQHKLQIKFRDLLNASDEEKYKQTLFEIRIGCYLGQKCGPVSIEPFALGPNTGGVTPPSADFGIKTDSGIIIFEATTVIPDSLVKWSNSSDNLTNALTKRISKSNESRNTTLTIPFGPAINIPGKKIKEAVDKILKTSTGNGSIDTAYGPLKFSWAEAVHLYELDFSDPSSMIGLPSSFTVGPSKPISVSAFSISMADDGNFENQMLKSLKNCLVEKKRQSPGASFPYIIALRPGHSKFGFAYIAHLIVNRIFPNPQFSWISAVAVFEEAPGYNLGDKNTLHYLYNDKAKYGVPELVQNGLFAG